MVYERSFEYLAERLTGRLDERGLDLVGRAYRLAEASHRGQMRDEGTPYIFHPLRVAVIFVDELGAIDPDCIAAALLHDVIEDCQVTRDQIAVDFGESVAGMVWLLTKLDEVPLAAYLAAIEAATGTCTSVLKLCDRLDNLRFLARSPRLEKKRRYIRTTEQYYLPMARRTNPYLYDELCRWLDRARSHVLEIPVNG